MLRIATLAALVLAGSAVLAAPPALDLETVMADPDWIGPAVESPRWSVDGAAIHYELKRAGSSVRDLHRIDPASGVDVKLDARGVAAADGLALFNRQRSHAAFIKHGDVFVVALRDGTRSQVTGTERVEAALQWSADGKELQFRAGNDWFAHDPASGLTRQLAILKTDDDPEAREPDDLGRLQLRLFSTLAEAQADREARRAHARELDRADPTRAPRPFWLGKNRKIAASALSPDGSWVLVATEPATAPGRAARVTHFVTRSGYSEAEDAHAYVGRRERSGHELIVLDLAAHTMRTLSFDALPGIHDDPLKDLRAASQAALRKGGHEDEAKALDAPKARLVRVSADAPKAMAFSDDGALAAIVLRAVDNKDRWIVSVTRDADAPRLEQRLTDGAWINWNFNDTGFVPGTRTLWYLSEETGFSHLYVKPQGGKARALTRGRFEVGHPVASDDGRFFYFLANAERPADYDVHRVAVAGGPLERITQLGGLHDAPFVLSPDGTRIATLASSAYMPPQLVVVDVATRAARQLTDTRSAAFKAIDWIEPAIVAVPSRHGAGSIWTKLYVPRDAPGTPRPAVIFVHGAGYLQDVTSSYSYYFREQMFANLLAAEGYVVISMDYRASQGYGRDWRTAIYRNMGHPELEDLLDGKAWLVDEHNVDPDRVGIYGGSYGGFMTFMALLRAPGEFAAGAALRPVTDWTTYNQGYTGAILNDPQIDPAAYRTSSPIEYAENLADPILILHGLIDDNVLAADAIRIYQRFIELRKKDFWISLYPLERHGFQHADAWYDEYRRIHELFTTYVKRRAPAPPAAGGL